MRNTTKVQAPIANTHPRSLFTYFKQTTPKTAPKMVAAFSLIGAVLTGLVFPVNQAMAANPAPDLECRSFTSVSPAGMTCSASGSIV
jgi:hypothetical protein